MTVLAELLNSRKALNTELSELTNIIAANNMLAEDDEDKESKRDEFYLALNVFDAKIAEWHALNLNIIKANNEAQVIWDGEPYSLTEAIILRDKLTRWHKHFNYLASTLKDDFFGYAYRSRRTKDDIKQSPIMKQSAFKKKADDLAESIRTLDIEIQKVNWSYEV